MTRRGRSLQWLKPSSCASAGATTLAQQPVIHVCATHENMCVWNRPNKQVHRESDSHIADRLGAQAGLAVELCHRFRFRAPFRRPRCVSRNRLDFGRISLFP